RRLRRSSKPCVWSCIDGRVVYWIVALDVGELTALGGTPQHERGSNRKLPPGVRPPPAWRASARSAGRREVGLERVVACSWTRSRSCPCFGDPYCIAIALSVPLA